MRKLRFRLRFAALAAVVLMLPMVACNDHDNPDNGEGVPRVIGVTNSGTSLAAVTEPVVSEVEVVIEDRSGSSGSFFNAVTFTNYTVDYFGVVPSITNGVINTAFIPVGSTGTLSLTVLSPADKGGFGVGSGLAGALHVDGQDLLGNPVSFDSALVIVFLP